MHRVSENAAKQYTEVCLTVLHTEMQLVPALPGTYTFFGKIKIEQN